MYPSSSSPSPRQAAGYRLERHSTLQTSHWGGGKEMFGESTERWTACERLSPSANCSMVPCAPGESSELAVVDGGKGLRG